MIFIIKVKNSLIFLFYITLKKPFFLYKPIMIYLTISSDYKILYWFSLMFWLKGQNSRFPIFTSFQISNKICSYCSRLDMYILVILVLQLSTFIFTQRMKCLITFDHNHITAFYSADIKPKKTISLWSSNASFIKEKL